MTMQTVPQTVPQASESEYRKELARQKREMQIVMIRNGHPVYENFNFATYSDQKVAEMFKILIESSKGGKETEAQTNV
jgi:hypothetical protein